MFRKFLAFFTAVLMLFSISSNAEGFDDNVISEIDMLLESASFSENQEENEILESTETFSEAELIQEPLNITNDEASSEVSDAADTASSEPETLEDNVFIEEIANDLTSDDSVVSEEFDEMVAAETVVQSTEIIIQEPAADPEPDNSSEEIIDLSDDQPTDLNAKLSEEVVQISTTDDDAVPAIPSTEITIEKETPSANLDVSAVQDSSEKIPSADTLSEKTVLPSESAPICNADTIGNAVPVEVKDVLTAAQTTVLPAATNSNSNNVEGFVTRLYETVFQRKPDADGFHYWVTRLDSGTNTAAEVVNYFFNSPEYQNSGKSNSQIVQDCYSTMLNRNPDSGGYQYWKQRLDVGMTPQVLLAGFVHSDEFTNISTKYGVNRGTIELTNARDKNYERTYFVYRLYENCLGRESDQAGEEYWCSLLDSGTSGAQVASGFFFSDEFNKSRYNNSAFVQLLYKAIQGRDYDMEGLIYWTTRLNYSDTREKVLNGFIASTEFHEQCETAQISAGDPIPTPDDTVEWQYNINVLRLCNQYRRQAGLADLYTREDLLKDLALARAREITELFSHTRPNGTSCFTLFTEQGFYGFLGENIATSNDAGGYDDPEKVVEAWMNSEGHRRNILDKDFTYLATGYVYDPNAYTYCAEGKYAGTYQNFTSYAAQSFCNYGFPIE